MKMFERFRKRSNGAEDAAPQRPERRGWSRTILSLVPFAFPWPTYLILTNHTQWEPLAVVGVTSAVTWAIALLVLRPSRWDAIQIARGGLIFVGCALFVAQIVSLFFELSLFERGSGDRLVTACGPSELASHFQGDATCRGRSRHVIGGIRHAILVTGSPRVGLCEFFGAEAKAETNGQSCRLLEAREDWVSAQCPGGLFGPSSCWICETKVAGKGILRTLVARDADCERAWILHSANVPIDRASGFISSGRLRP